MTAPKEIAEFLQQQLQQRALDEVPAVEAANWLDSAGLLDDSHSRPGLPLRELLRAGAIAGAEQRPATSHGRWFVVRRGGGSTTATPMATTDVRHLGATTPHKGDAGMRGFTREALAGRGFAGFARFKELDLGRVPVGEGVYVILREKEERPRFLDRSPAGWFKGLDPTVAVAELEASWPDGAHCVYIGKASSGTTGKRGLRKRIRELRRFGDGEPIGHQGGRRIWQLSDADDYLIAWLLTPNDDPERVEGELIRAFVDEYGVRPIGNRTSGRRP